MTVALPNQIPGDRHLPAEHVLLPDWLDDVGVALRNEVHGADHFHHPAVVLEDGMTNYLTVGVAGDCGFLRKRHVFGGRVVEVEEDIRLGGYEPHEARDDEHDEEGDSAGRELSHSFSYLLSVWTVVKRAICIL